MVSHLLQATHLHPSFLLQKLVVYCCCLSVVSGVFYTNSRENDLPRLGKRMFSAAMVEDVFPERGLGQLSKRLATAIDMEDFYQRSRSPALKEQKDSISRSPNKDMLYPSYRDNLQRGSSGHVDSQEEYRELPESSFPQLPVSGLDTADRTRPPVNLPHSYILNQLTKYPKVSRGHSRGQKKSLDRKTQKLIRSYLPEDW